MQLLSTRFRERNLKVVGILMVTLLVGGIIAAFNAGTVIAYLENKTYTAELSDAGDLQPKNAVEVAGDPVGTVSSVRLAGDHVQVRFSVKRAVHLGQLAAAQVKTATPLGTKFLAITPAGSGDLTTAIPLSRTRSAFDVTEALDSLTSTSEEIDTAQLSKSLTVMATAFAGTPKQIAPLLAGVKGLSTTIASRDQSLSQLLSATDTLSGVLADRSQQLTDLASQGNLLLAELYQRRDDIHTLLVNATAAVQDLAGLAADNAKQLGPTLTQLHSLVSLLQRNDANIASVIQGLTIYARTLGDGVSNGPSFAAYVDNLTFTNLASLGISDTGSTAAAKAGG